MPLIIVFLLKVFVGRFVPRKEREIELGEKAKRFTNVYVKNFNEAMTEEDLQKMFEKFGKITSLKVSSHFMLHSKSDKMSCLTFVMFLGDLYLSRMKSQII